MTWMSWLSSTIRTLTILSPLIILGNGIYIIFSSALKFKYKIFLNFGMKWLPKFEITTDKRHAHFLKEAYIYALNANDNSTKNGAVIVNNGKIISFGRSGLPEALDEPRFHERPLKYDLVKHAERDSIYSAMEQGIILEGMIMYCPWYACEKCANVIAVSGIETVIGHYEMMEKTRDDWKKDVVSGWQKLHEEGVKTLLYRGKIGDFENLMNGQIWYP